MTKPEKILEAAIRFEGKIYTGKRHYECIKKAAEETGKYIGSDGQGFITESGRFVNRQEAARIAFEAGQIDHLKDRLISEDIY